MVISNSKKILIYLFISVICNLFHQQTVAQNNSFDKNFINPILLNDSMPKEFGIDISNYIKICTDGTFEKYERTGVFSLGQLQKFNDIPLRNPLMQPVNELNLIFTIHNLSKSKQIVYIELGLPDLFKIADLDDSLKKIDSGGFMGKSNKVSSFSPSKYVPLFIQPQKTAHFLAYVKFMGTYKEKIVPKLISEKTYQLNSIHEIDKTRLELLYHSFIMGGIFIISIFMFAQFFLNKDKAYLLYAAYGICMFLLSEKIMELNCNINLISYFIPTYVFYSHIILQLFACYFYTGFLIKLLDITKENKAIYWYCNIIQKLILLACVANLSFLFINDNTAFVAIAFNFGSFISTLSMLPLLILLIFHKPKDLAVKFVIVGFSAVVFGALIVVYINRSGLNTKFNLLGPVSIIEFAIFIEMIFFGLALGYKTFKQKKEKENIELQKKETEMAALKAQMNPHFMFNCINSIDSFIQTNDKYNATLYLNKFAKLIRNVLDSSKQNVVPFSKDIETLKLYIELEELRSDNKFKIDFYIDDDLMSDDFKVPPLIMQPYVENAIIHGLRNREDNTGLLSISIQKQNNCIHYVITDNGIGRLAASKIIQNKDTHFGMQMSYDRIKLFNKETKPSVVITDLNDGQQSTGTKIDFYLNII